MTLKEAFEKDSVIGVDIRISLEFYNLNILKDNSFKECPLYPLEERIWWYSWGLYE